MIKNILKEKNVKHHKLSEITDAIFSGGTPITTISDYYDGDIPWIRSGEIDFNSIHESERKITSLGLEKSSAKWVREQSVLIALTGATAGKSAVNEIRLTTNQSCACIEVNREILNYKYLYYYLVENYQMLLQRRQGAMSSLNLGIIKDLIIPLPSLEVQNEIVHILDKFSAIEAELEAELEARILQYQFYKEKLLNEIEVDDTVVIDDLLGYIQPTKYIVKKADYNDKFKTPVLTAGKTFLLGYTHETEGIYPASHQEPVIIFDDFTTSFHWVDFPFKVKSSALKIIKPKSDNFNFRYVYYAMKNLDFQKSDGVHQRHWISIYSQLEIEMPTLEIQNKIVSVLDKFSTISSNIKEGIPAEIDVRKQQYEYYRNKLLTFESEV